MNRAVFSHESSCLASCKLLHVSVHCCLVFVQSVKEANVRTYSLATGLVLTEIAYL